MVEFLRSNWQFIVVCVAGLTELILMLVFKKRPEVIDNSLLMHLCSWILQAESRFKIGEEKMNYVLEEAKKYLGEKYVEKDVRTAVEYLLVLPEKKGK